MNLLTHTSPPAAAAIAAIRAVLPLADIRDCAAFANATAACAVQKRGCIPSLPHIEEVVRMIAS